MRCVQQLISATLQAILTLQGRRRLCIDALVNIKKYYLNHTLVE
jgi:hypothetical protein